MPPLPPTQDNVNLGAVILTHRPRVGPALLAVLCALGAILFALGTWAALNAGWAHRPGRSMRAAADPTLIMIVGSVFALTCGFVCYLQIVRLRTSIVFYELGCRYRRGRSTHVIDYASATRLRVAITKIKIYASVTVGVSIQLRLDTPRRPVVTMSASTNSALTTGSPPVPHPLLAVRDAMALAMADRWLTQLGSGQTIEVSKVIAATPLGLRLGSGPRKGHIVPYDLIEHDDQPFGATTLRIVGDPSPLIKVPSATPNLYPLLTLLVLAAEAPIQQPGPGAAADMTEEEFYEDERSSRRP